MYDEYNDPEMIMLYEEWLNGTGSEDTLEYYRELVSRSRDFTNYDLEDWNEFQECAGE